MPENNLLIKRSIFPW